MFENTHTHTHDVVKLQIQDNKNAPMYPLLREIGIVIARTVENVNQKVIEIKNEKNSM